MWTKALAAIVTFGVMGAAAPLLSFANESANGAVAKFMPSAKVSLQEGLKAAETEGQPISGKFEVDNGSLQLSVYTAKDGKFTEVRVDQSTGKVTKAEVITEANGLEDVEKQMEAYSKAKIPLKAAVSQAELAYPGYRAVSVTPMISKGRPVAVVSLLQGNQARSIAEPLT